MRLLPVILLLIVGGLIAVGVALAKAAAPYGIAGPEFALWLSLGAGLILFVVTRIRGETIPLTRQHITYYLVTGLVSLAAPNALSFLIANHAGAAFGSVPYALSPLITYPIAITVGLDRPQLRRFLGLAIGFAGTALVLYEMAAATGANAGPIWLLAALAIPLCVATGNVYRSARWPKGATDMALATAMLLTSVLWLLPLVATRPIAAFRHGIGGGELIIFAQMIASAAMYWFYFWLQRIAGPVYLSQIGYVAAGFGVFFAVVFFGEALAAAVVVGLVMIAAGVSLVRARRAPTGSG
jgi:drug/metabolite transporter (DMT)-like permease